MVIAKDDMMGVLLNACPSFEPGWHSFLAEWQDEPDDLPLYLALADFARHLIGMLARGETESFPRVFHSVERLHVEGDDYVREAVRVGLLEDLQNLNLHTTTQPDQFRPYLGPASEECWDELTRFWSGTAGGS